MNNSFFTITSSLSPELNNLAKKFLDTKTNTSKSKKNLNKQKKHSDKQKEVETQEIKPKETVVQKNVQKVESINTNQINNISNLIDIDKDNLSKYILYSEILGTPVCKRNSGRH